MELFIFIISVALFGTSIFFARQKMRESRQARLRVEEEQEKFSSI
ncbi:hypothetical protein [Terrimonas ferruginea]|jgi:hypothetical protein|nr:hypothetical protein [Terrimonas ferruginea]